MSLKAFHIVFIAITSLLSFLVGGWAISGGAKPSVALIGFGAGIALVSYGVWFWRKIKREGLQ